MVLQCGRALGRRRYRAWARRPSGTEALEFSPRGGPARTDDTRRAPIRRHTRHDTTGHIKPQVHSFYRDRARARVPVRVIHEHKHFLNNYLE